MTPEMQFRFVLEKQEQQREHTALRRLIPDRGPLLSRALPALRVLRPQRSNVDEPATPALKEPAW